MDKIAGSLENPPLIFRFRMGLRQAVIIPPVLVLSFVARYFITADVDAGVHHSPTVVLIWTSVCLLMIVTIVVLWFWRWTLELTAAGVSLTGPLGARRWSWDDVKDFRPVSYRGIRNVGFDFTQPNPKETSRRHLMSRTWGAEGLIRARMEMDQAHLADLLNQARRHWRGDQPDPVVEPARISAGLRARAGLVNALNGRTDRKTYWLIFAGVAAVAAIVAEVWNPLGGGFCLLVGWNFASTGRMRDISVAPIWRVLLFPMAFAAFMLAGLANAGLTIAFICAGATWVAASAVLGFLPSTKGTNRYGMEPGDADQRRIGENFS